MKPSDLKTEELAPVFYIGIGASAGGLEALDAFFNSAPEDADFAFIVIQHLSPDHKSLMVELLSKRTSMKVCRAEDNMRVQRNTVYLIPPKKTLRIFHGNLLLNDIDHRNGLNLPIDIFFRSLAEDQGERAIGVILSGTGSDGARGLRSIKEAGGLVFVQSPETAKFDGMPRAAIDTGLVDVILPPDEMPNRLLAIAKHPMAVAEVAHANISETATDLTRIFSLLRERERLDFTFYKPSTVLRRIERRISVCQCNDLQDYVRLLETHPSEVTTLYKELLIGVTCFFRDRETFDTLQAPLLELIRNKPQQEELRFWVAGCSTGEEAYTLAILVQECLQQLGRTQTVKIFATDVDKEAIVRAGTGVYPDSITPDLPQNLLTKYFSHRNDEYVVQRHLREIIVFAQHNLIKDPPFTGIDLISCRNLLIYLQPVLQQKVFEYFNFSLKPNGLLLLGSSESLGDMADLFDQVDVKSKIFRSRGKRHRPIENHAFVAGTSDPASQISVQNPARGHRARLIREEERVLEQLLETITKDYSTMVAVVNEHFELIHLVGDSSGILSVPTGKHSNDITRMIAKDLSIPLSTGLQKVFRGKSEVRFSSIRLPDGDNTKVIQIDLREIRVRRGQDPLAAIIIREAQPVTAESPGKSITYDFNHEAEQRIRDLEQELQLEKENLQATIEELETSNEELQATNEELLASNEELQSTNEELQSVNEELHTVNAEFQAKILEYTEMANDLDNLTASMRVALLYLDENLTVRKFTPELSKIIHVMRSDVGRPLHHLNHNLIEEDPLKIATEVLRSGLAVEHSIKTRDGGLFLMRVIPYKVGGAINSGVLLTFLDVKNCAMRKVFTEDRCDCIETDGNIPNVISPPNIS